MTYDLGDTVALGIEVKDSTGALANATAVACTITLPDGTTAAGTVLNPSTGTYTVDYVPTSAGRFLVRWVATGLNAGAYTDTFDVRATDDVPVVSLTEAKRHLNITTTTSDDELRRYLDAATDLCESYTGRSLRRRTVSESHNGGSAVLVLRQIPVVSVTTVVEDAVTYSDFIVDAPNGLLYRDADGASTWSAGRQVVDVTYVAGYTAPPADVQQAVLETLRHLWTTQRGTMSGRNPFQGDEYAAGTGWSLPRRAQELLDAYTVKGV